LSINTPEAGRRSPWEWLFTETLLKEATNEKKIAYFAFKSRDDVFEGGAVEDQGDNDKGERQEGRKIGQTSPEKSN